MERSTSNRESSTSEREQRSRRRSEARASSTYREFLTLASVETGRPEQDTERIVLSVLSALARRLPSDEMKDMASQLPRMLRELLDSVEEPEDAPPAREIKQPEFVDMVARDLEIAPEQAEEHVRAVFRVLPQTVTHGEVEEVVHVLPVSLRRLWPPLN